MNSEETATMIKNFADACAKAYVNQYIADKPVMGDPVVYYNKSSAAFGVCSSLTGLSDDEVEVERINEPGVYGETGDDPDTARQAITDYITSTLDVRDLLDKIELPAREMAEMIYHIVYGDADNKRLHAAKVAEITDWLSDGESFAGESASDLASEWIDYDQA